MPFFIKGETAWLALANLTEGEQERYLADRGAKGFNLVEVMLTNHDYTTSPAGATFESRRRAAVPEAGRFLHAQRRIFRSGAGVRGSRGGPRDRGAARPWLPGLRRRARGLVAGAQFSREHAERLRRFRPYLGTRFKEKKNLIWLAGGDFTPPAGSEGEARHREILDGIRAAGHPSHGPGTGTSNTWVASPPIRRVSSMP